MFHSPAQVEHRQPKIEFDVELEHGVAGPLVLLKEVQ